MGHIFPDPKEHNYQIGESFSLGDLTYCIKGVTCTPVRQFSEKHEIPLMTNYADEWNITVVYVDLEVTNHSDEVVQPEIYSLVLSSPVFSNGIDAYMLEALQGGSRAALLPEIAPHESFQISIPWQEIPDNYGVDGTDLLSLVPLEVVFTLYPEKTTVRLNDLWED